MRNKQFIRLENNNHVAPFDSNGKPQAYLPGISSTDFRTEKTVKKVIADDNKAREFLEELRLPEPDFHAEVIEAILPKYQKDKIGISNDENLDDVKKIIYALKNALPDKKEELHNELNKSYLLKVIKPVLQKKYWCNPCCIYLAEHFIETKILEKYFEGNPDIYFLDEMYSDFIKEELLELGCLDNVRVTYRKPNDDGHIDIQKHRGHNTRGLNGFDPDCEIEGLKYALEHITAEKAQIIWNILKQHHQRVSGTVESSSYQYYGNSNKEERASKMGELVRVKKWLPDKYGNFHTPSNILLSDLPDVFDKESTEAKVLAEKLGFQKDIEQEFLSRLPEEKRERYQLAEGLSEEEVELIKEHRKRKEASKEEIQEESFNYSKELGQTFNCPQIKEHEESHISPDAIPDPTRRREKVQGDIQSSKDIEPQPSERFKRVPTKKWEQKNCEAKAFLSEQYDGKCQICNYSFTKRDGEPYCEGVYLVSRTKAAWIDRPGNVLCLCANCSTKFMYGSVEAGNILEQINGFKCINEGGTENIATIRLKLCDEDVKLIFTERHIVDLQEILKSAKEGIK